MATTELPLVCQSCSSHKCADLYWKKVTVYADRFAVPFDCPFLVNDDRRVRQELNLLDEREVTRFSQDVWMERGHGVRCIYSSNVKAEEIDHIVHFWNLGKCVVLSKTWLDDFRPWATPGFNGGWADDVGGTLSNTKPADDDLSSPALTDDLADEMAAQRQRDKIKLSSPSFAHTDATRKQNSPQKATEGDTVTLKAKTEFLNNGEDVTFIVYDVSGGSPVRIGSANGTNRDGQATADWVVDTLQCKSDVPKLEFEAVAQEKKTPTRCAIPLDLAHRYLSSF